MDSTIRSPGQSDDDLLRRMRTGDREAFRDIYRRCQGPIYRFALHMSGNSSTAEDVTQEVFMALLKSDCTFDSSRGTLLAYLFGVARNHLLRHWEKEGHYVSFPEGEESAPSSRTNGNHHPNLIVLPVDLAKNEMIGRVRQAILSLPVNYREAAVLCDLQEMSYEETAKILGCAVGTVRSRLHRARTLLMQKLRDTGSPSERLAAGKRAPRP
jgi:RNA polymerase sigma-70 factor (ECF subfamily)